MALYTIAPAHCKAHSAYMLAQLYLKNSSMYLLPRMKLTFPQQIMGFAAMWHGNATFPFSSLEIFLRIWGFLFFISKQLQTLLKSDTTTSALFETQRTRRTFCNCYLEGGEKAQSSQSHCSIILINLFWSLQPK